MAVEEVEGEAVEGEGAAGVVVGAEGEVGEPVGELKEPCIFLTVPAWMELRLGEAPRVRPGESEAEPFER